MHSVQLCVLMMCRREKRQKQMSLACILSLSYLLPWWYMKDRPLSKTADHRTQTPKKKVKLLSTLWRRIGAVEVDCVWNAMAHAQKPDFVFRRNGRVHLNRQGASVQSTAGSRGVRNSGSNAGYTMFRGCVQGTGNPIHSPVSPSLSLPCFIVGHHISTGVYHLILFM